MSKLVSHLPWIAPTVAILAVGSNITDKINISFGDQPTAAVEQLELDLEPAVETAPVEVAAVAEPVPAEPEVEVEVEEAVVAEGESQEAGVPLVEAEDLVDAGNVSSQLAALLKENNVTDYTVGVTRNDGFSIDSLIAATGDAIDAQDGIDTANEQATGPVNEDFFAIARANLARDRQCIDDLVTLSGHARVYFPVGGVIGEQTGIDQARLLGLLAEQCDGVVIQVEGHSDASGNSVVNQGLSENRAAEVVNSVVASGIDPTLFEVVGFGDTQPSFVTGPQPDFYYDRRVEFSIIETAIPASFVAPQDEAATVGTALEQASCVAQLEIGVQNASIEYAPSGVAVAPADLALAAQLANIAQNCPEARLRLVGQHSADPGAHEDEATGRLRAVVLQSLLVSQGYASEQLILGAPSDPVPVNGLSDSRLDFEVILEDL